MRRAYMRDFILYAVCVVVVLVMFTMPIMCIANPAKYKPHIFCSVPVMVFIAGAIVIGIVGLPRKHTMVTQEQCDGLTRRRNSNAYNKLMRDHLAELRKPGGLLDKSAHIIHAADNPEHVVKAVTNETMGRHIDNVMYKHWKHKRLAQKNNKRR